MMGFLSSSMKCNSPMRLYDGLFPLTVTMYIWLWPYSSAFLMLCKRCSFARFLEPQVSRCMFTSMDYPFAASTVVLDWAVLYARVSFVSVTLWKFTLQWRWLSFVTWIIAIAVKQISVMLTVVIIIITVAIVVAVVIFVTVLRMVFAYWAWVAVWLYVSFVVTWRISMYWRLISCAMRTAPLSLEEETSVHWHWVACLQAVVLRLMRLLYILQERCGGNCLLDIWYMCYDAWVIGIAFVCKERGLNARGAYVLVPRINHACGTCLLVKRWKSWLE